MTPDEATRKAMELIPCTCGGYGKEGGRHLTDCPRHGIAWEDIAAALVEANRAGIALGACDTMTRSGLVDKPLKGYVITDDGVVRKVLGRLVPTGDGCIIGTGARYYLKPSRSQPLVRERNMRPTALEWHSTVFSTKEAAEAARKEKA